MSDNIFQIPLVTRHFSAHFVPTEDKLPWHIVDRDIPAYWPRTGAGAGVKVAVLDTGVDPDHPGLEGKISDYISMVGDDGVDRAQHGTHVCGLIADKFCGYAPQASIVSVKVLGDDGTGHERNLISGVEAAIDYGCDIINLSLGAPGISAKFVRVIRQAFEKGIICVAATGNESALRISYPAALDHYVIAVGAVNRSKKHASFSNYNNRTMSTDMVDYGVEILSTIPDGRYAVFSGTSMATPLASAGIANVISMAKKHGAWMGDMKEKYALLQYACEDVGTPSRDKKSGWGMIDPRQAFTVDLLSKLNPNLLQEVKEDPKDEVLARIIKRGADYYLSVVEQDGDVSEFAL